MDKGEILGAFFSSANGTAKAAGIQAREAEGLSERAGGGLARWGHAIHEVPDRVQFVDLLGSVVMIELAGRAHLRVDPHKIRACVDLAQAELSREVVGDIGGRLFFDLWGSQSWLQAAFQALDCYPPLADNQLSGVD